MANYGKRMVPEYLVKGLEEAYTKTSGGTGSTINLLENIVDSKGNKRFIEGNGSIQTLPAGLSINYAKWSLSGTHLMLVASGSATVGTSIPNGTSLVAFNLPEYILDKVKIIWSSDALEVKETSFYSATWDKQDTTFCIVKTQYGIILKKNLDFTISTTTRGFRVQFDLLIDTD